MGTNKSKAIEILAGIENFSDQSIFGVRDREQQELLAGVWLYEIAELSNIRKTEVEHIKAFASRTHDRARPAYGRTRVDQPRRCVLFATTNNDQYLKEADRRFWPVKTTDIDVEALKRDRDQLWAEAAQREREGASIVLRRELWEMARTEQQAREEADPWDDILVGSGREIEQGEERVFSRDLLEIVLGIHQSKLLDRDSNRLAKCMRRLGWKKVDAVRIGEQENEWLLSSSQGRRGMTRKMGTTTKDRVLTLQHSYRKRSTVKRPSLFCFFWRERQLKQPWKLKKRTFPRWALTALTALIALTALTGL